MKTELRTIFIKLFYLQYKESVRLHNMHRPVALFGNPGSDLEPVHEKLNSNEPPKYSVISWFTWPIGTLLMMESYTSSPSLGWSV